MKIWHSDRLPHMTREEEQEKLNQIAQTEFTWKDRLILVVTAFTHLFLPAALILLAAIGLTLALFGLL